jgi:hypothetical protein
MRDFLKAVGSVMIKSGQHGSAELTFRIEAAARYRALLTLVHRRPMNIINTEIEANAACAGMKISDVDPYLERGYGYEISAKASVMGSRILMSLPGASIDLRLTRD